MTLAERCEARWLIAGECDRVEWAAMLWSLAFLPTTVVIEGGKGSE
jgi:hypothetical protein